MKVSSKFIFLVLFTLGIVFFLRNIFDHDARVTGIPTSEIKTVSRSDTVLLSNKDIPGYVLDVLQYVLIHENPMPGYVGGRQFYNREKKLPQKKKNGAIIQYREWDVHPKKPGKNRGAERLITSDAGLYYYTNDHYQSFQKIKP